MDFQFTSSLGNWKNWEEDLSITVLSTFFEKEVQDDGKLGSSLSNSNTRPAGGKKLAQI